MARIRLLALVVVALVALALPAAASSHKGRPTCDGRRATIVGTEGADHLTGTKAGDVIVAGRGDDLISGLGGNDTILSEKGHDSVDGGPGSDTVDYSTEPAGVVVDLAKGASLVSAGTIR